MKYFLRTIIGLSVIMLALSVTALSCNKVGDDKNNANNSGSGSGGSGSGSGSGGGNNGGGTVSTYKGKLGLSISTKTFSANNFAKVVGDTIYINAGGYAAVADPLSKAAPADRGFEDHPFSGNTSMRNFAAFDYGGGKSVLYFVVKSSITTNEIAVQAASASTLASTAPTCLPSGNQGEDGNNTLAATSSGGFCRGYWDFRSNGINDTFTLESYMGSIFNNTTAGSARGQISCAQFFSKTVSGATANITDTLELVADVSLYCTIGVVNSAVVGSTGAEIDDNWVDDVNAVKEVELYVIGVDVTGKTYSDVAGALGVGSTLADFDKAWDNAAIKSLLSKYEWKDLKFKVKIVKSTEYATL